MSPHDSHTLAREAIDRCFLLGDAEKRLLRLYLHLGRKDGCFMKPATVAARLGWSVRKMIRTRERLVDVGLVSKGRIAGRRDMRNQAVWHVQLPSRTWDADSIQEAADALDDSLNYVGSVKFPPRLAVLLKSKLPDAGEFDDAGKVTNAGEFGSAEGNGKLANTGKSKLPDAGKYKVANAGESI